MPVYEFQDNLQRLASRWGHGAGAALLASAALTHGGPAFAATANLQRTSSMVTSPQSNHATQSATSLESERIVFGLRQLNDNWDGYGSPAVPELVLDRVGSVLRTAEREGLTNPNVVPFEGSGVQVEWCGPGYDLEMVVHRDGQVEYLLFDQDAEVVDEDRAHNVDADVVRRFVQRFTELARGARE